MITNTEIKPWRERVALFDANYMTVSARQAADAEIAELRAALEAKQQALEAAQQVAQRAGGGAGETWLPVVGFSGLYEVSDVGNIRNLLTGRLISDRSMAGAGYPKASLWKDGQRTQTYFHRVVATAFLGECNGREVKLS